VGESRALDASWRDGQTVDQADRQGHGAHIAGAILSGADLRDADLSGAKYLTQAQLDQASSKPKALPPGLTLDKPSSGSGNRVGECDLSDILGSKAWWHCFVVNGAETFVRLAEQLANHSEVLGEGHCVGTRIGENEFLRNVPSKGLEHGVILKNDADQLKERRSSIAEQVELIDVAGQERWNRDCSLTYERRDHANPAPCRTFGPLLLDDRGCPLVSHSDIEQFGINTDCDALCLQSVLEGRGRNLPVGGLPCRSGLEPSSEVGSDTGDQGEDATNETPEVGEYLIHVAHLAPLARRQTHGCD
jgi:hypothetical protein